MIPVGLVLFRIQNFQQCGTGIAPVIGAHFIHLVQQEQRIPAARLGHGCHDPAGHSTYIGLAVTADIRCIVNAAQRDPGHFPVQAPGNGISNGGLTHTGRANQTQDLRRHLRGHLPDGDGLQNALLNLFQAIVLTLQNLGCCFHTDPLLGGSIPGQFQNRIQIIAQNRCFGRTKGLLFQPFQVLKQLLFRGFLQIQGQDLLFIVGKFRPVVPLAQFLADDLHLLPQIIIPLIPVDVGMGLLLNSGLQMEHLDLPTQQTQRAFQTAGGIELAQEFGLIRIVDTGILGNGIRQITGVAGGDHAQQNTLGRMLRQLHIGAVQGIGFPAHGMVPGGIRYLRLRNCLHVRLQKGFKSGQLPDPTPAQTGDQYPKGLPMGLEDLLDLHYHTNRIQLIQIRVIIHNVLLRHKENMLTAFHSVFQRLDGLHPAHIKVDCLVWEHRQAPQGHHRQSAGYDQFAHKITFVYLERKGAANAAPLQ